jgi:hypothetical protein
MKKSFTNRKECGNVQIAKDGSTPERGLENTTSNTTVVTSANSQRRRETVAPGYLHRASQPLKRLSITRMLGAAVSVCDFLVHGMRDALM